MLNDDTVGHNIHDMQAMLGAGFARLRHADYWLLRVRDRALARAWLADILADGLVASVADLGGGNADGDVTSDRNVSRGINPGGRLQDAIVTVAFTFRGLRRLGIREAAHAPFPSPFRDAMTSPARRALLRDGPLAEWQWGDAPWRRRRDCQVDMLVAHFRLEADVPDASPLHPHRMNAAGVTVVQRVRTCPGYLGREQNGGGVVRASEPFGFADGISQPVLAGMPRSRSQRAARDAAGTLFEDRVVAPGEFILGHRNEYGEPAWCPDVQGWRATTAQVAQADRSGVAARFGTNGSYLVARQIWQDVEAFRRTDARHPCAPGQPSVVEKMVGRRKDGSPLLTEPHPPAEIDAFRYRQADAEGLQCPRGAHIRRSNPRDTLGWSVESGVRIAKLHRLLRRGRTYAGSDRACEQGDATACGDLALRHTCGKGVFFIALNADLDRQFEFVQQQWIVNTDFGDLGNEDDPLLGAHSPRAFSMPGLPFGQRAEGFETLTRTIGGGYFFMPGLSALRFIAG